MLFDNLLQKAIYTTHTHRTYTYIANNNEFYMNAKCVRAFAIAYFIHRFKLQLEGLQNIILPLLCLTTYLHTLYTH